MMKDNFVYQGFEGSCQYSTVDAVFYGKLENTKDLVMYEGESVAALQVAFEEAVEDYVGIRSLIQ